MARGCSTHDVNCSSGLCTSDIKMMWAQEFAPKLCHLRGQEKHKSVHLVPQTCFVKKTKVTNSEPQKSLILNPKNHSLIKDFS